MTDQLKQLSEAATEEAKFLIQKSGTYYRPNSQGYTNSAIQAGRYTLTEAINITHPNGPSGPRENMWYYHEDEIVCKDWQAYSALEAQLAEAQAREAVAYRVVKDVKDQWVHKCCEHPESPSKWHHRKYSAPTTDTPAAQGDSDE